MAAGSDDDADATPGIETLASFRGALVPPPPFVAPASAPSRGVIAAAMVAFAAFTAAFFAGAVAMGKALDRKGRPR